MSSEELEPIISVCVYTTPEAEEPVAALLEWVFDTTPSVWSDTITHQAKVTVYLERDAIEAEEEQALRRGIEVIRESGLDAGAGNWDVLPVKREDWSESWKKHFHPIEIGDRLLLKPDWEEVEAKPGQAVVTLNPGLSFGTGHHPTTLFCLKQLAANAQGDVPRSFLDAGTGSGILAISAAKLGYVPIEAWDYDPQAVDVARENASQNGLAESLKFDVRDLTEMPAGGRQFDVICANLIYDLLIAEREKLTSWLAPDGRLVMAGILIEQFPGVQEAFCGLGMELVESETLDEWCSGVFRFF
tara:strand:- start:556 stop:1458 length:903 start_codon:yes stop_codon:yes gene_type:complete